MPDLTAIEGTLQTLLARKLYEGKAELLAHQTGLVRRHSKLTGSLILLILVAGFIQQSSTQRPHTTSWLRWLLITACNSPARLLPSVSPHQQWPFFRCCSNIACNCSSSKAVYLSPCCGSSPQFISWTAAR